MPVPVFVKLGVYVMPHEASLMTFFIDPSQQKYQHYRLSYCWGNTLSVTWLLEQVVMKLGIYVMPPEAISMAYFLNPSHQQYQYCILSNCCNNHNITLFSELLIIKLSLYIMLPEAHIMHFISDTNTAASKIVEAVTLILLHCLNWLSWNFICILCHLNSVLHKSLRVSTETTASQIVLFHWLHCTQKKTLWGLVCQQPIPTEWPPLVGEVSANFSR
jgi:hypothetical protein